MQCVGAGLAVVRQCVGAGLAVVRQCVGAGLAVVRQCVGAGLCCYVCALCRSNASSTGRPTVRPPLDPLWCRWWRPTHMHSTQQGPLSTIQ